MKYTQRKIEEARARIEVIRARPCPHERIDWSYIIDFCLDCRQRL